MSKAKFIVARELIKEKNYDAARALLVTIDHPLATDWLAKLDRLAPAAESTAESSSTAADVDVFTELPTVEELTATAPEAVKPTSAPGIPAKESDEPIPGTPPDAEVAPVAPHPLPAPASHAAFRRPDAQTAVAAPDKAEPVVQKNVKPKSGAAAERANGRKAPAKSSSAGGAKAASRAPDGRQATTPTAPQTATWKAWASWLLLGTPAPNEVDQIKAATNGAPVDDRTPDDDDEAVDWRDLPSHANGTRVDEMPWLSGKLDNRSSFRPVSTLSNSSLSHAQAGESLEWEFAAELPVPQPELDVLTGVDVDGSADQRVGRRFFDGLNLIVLGVFLCGLFAFLVMSRQAASAVGETYSIGIFEWLVVGSGVLLVILGIWRIIQPNRRAD